MRAKWTNVAHQILTSLSKGDSNFQGPLPSGRALANYFGVSAPVMGKALCFLADEGLIARSGPGRYASLILSPSLAQAELEGWELNTVGGYWTRPVKCSEPGSECFREVLG